MFEVSMKVLGVCSEGEGELLHKLVKDESITMSITAAAGDQEEL